MKEVEIITSVHQTHPGEEEGERGGEKGAGWEKEGEQKRALRRTVSGRGDGGRRKRRYLKVKKTAVL